MMQPAMERWSRVGAGAFLLVLATACGPSSGDESAPQSATSATVSGVGGGVPVGGSGGEEPTVVGAGGAGAAGGGEAKGGAGGGQEVPLDCDAVVTHNIPLTGTTDPWISAYGTGYTFTPGTVTGSVAVRVPRGTYRSVAFAPLNIGDGGGFVFEQTAPFVGPAGKLLVVISRCVGDFGGPTSTVVDPACIRGSGGTGIMTFGWSTDPAASPNVCKLVPGETYFFNLMHAQSPDDITTTSCSQENCGTLVLGQ